MTDVRMLELAGIDVPHLQLRQDRLETLAGELEQGPHLRLLELCAPGDLGPISWPSIVSLRRKAHQLLNRQDLIQRVLTGQVVQLEVSGAPRVLAETWGALRAQAQVQHPMIVLDIAMPNLTAAVTARVLERWRHVLQDEITTAPRARIERAPPAQPVAAAEAARAHLDALLRDDARFLDSVAVGRLLSGNPDHANPKMLTTRARQARRLFGAWDGNAYRYPAFQFGPDGQPVAEMPALIAVLPRDPGENDGGRDAAAWLFAPDAALNGRTPADMFVDDPARVIELARIRRDGDDAVD